MKLPYPVPVPPARMTDAFGSRPSFSAGGKMTSPKHGGQDWAPPIPNQRNYPARASGKGRVVATRIGNRRSNVWGNKPIYNNSAGNYIIVEYTTSDNDPFLWYYGINHSRIWVGYCHLASVVYPINTWVNHTSIIGRLGATGAARGIHLHTDVFVDSPSMGNYAFDRRINPMLIFRKETPVTKPVTPPVKKEENTLSAAEVDRIIDHLDKTVQSRNRADTRGFVYLDLGPEGHLAVEQALHAVYIGDDGVLVMHPPTKYGMGQINSFKGGSGEDRTDYRWVDSSRWAAPLISQRFINRVKDGLTARNHFGDDRNVTVEEAWAWIAKHEALKKTEALANGEPYRD